MKIEEIQEELEDYCNRINGLAKSEKPRINILSRATGSAVGTQFERHFQGEIVDILNVDIFNSLEFVQYVINEYLSQMPLAKLRKKVWWAELQQISDNAVKRIQRGEAPKLQQAFGDIILKYDNGPNDIISLDIKSTEVSNGRPTGRDPNIVSAKRLLEFFTELFSTKSHLVDKVHIWFVGFDYTPLGGGEVRIEKAHLRNLLKLDLDKAPPINFDAAIQIQWHLNKMIERKDQTLDEFAERLSEKFQAEWKLFTARRDKTLNEVITRLDNAIADWRS